MRMANSADMGGSFQDRIEPAAPSAFSRRVRREARRDGAESAQDPRDRREPDFGEPAQPRPRAPRSPGADAASEGWSEAWGRVGPQVRSHRRRAEQPKDAERPEQPRAASGANAPSSAADAPDSAWSAWSRSVDHFTIGACVILYALGVILAFAASPGLAGDADDPFRFAWRQMAYGAPAFALLFLCSFLGPSGVRRAGFVIAAIGFVGLAAVLGVGQEHGKEATRWLSVFGLSMQPTEILKPGLVVLCAFFLTALSHPEPTVARAGAAISALFLGAALLLLGMQPDWSQAAILLAVWGGMFFIAGGPVGGVLALAAAGLLTGAVVYQVEPYFASRIDTFFGPDHEQLESAHAAVMSGGWLGRGIGEGVLKASVPDAHADFILAVAAEEFGVVFLLGVLALFALVVLRALASAAESADPFTRVAASGLALLLGVQAMVNIAVISGMAPITGVTLPFLSYGGSSMLATGVTMGLLLGLIRRRPRPIERDLAGD